MVRDKYVIFIAVAQFKKGAGIIQQDIGIDDVRFALVHRFLFYSAKGLDTILADVKGNAGAGHLTAARVKEDADP